MDKKESTTFPSINNYRSRKEWETACWRKILESKELLSLFITSHERRDLIMRAATMDRITSGKSYQEIAEELWISPQTISVIKKAINEKVYRSYPGRKERKKKVYSFNSTFEKSKNRHRGRRHRTKFGTIYMPY